MKQQTQKAVTVRFPMKDYLELVSEAEDQSTTTAEVVRRIWADYLEQKKLATIMANLEKSILIKTFEICSATIGLSEDERNKAIRQINESLGKELIR